MVSIEKGLDRRIGLCQSVPAMNKHDRTSIKVWLAKEDKTQGWLAYQLNVSQGCLSLWLHGHRRMPPKAIDRLEKVTGVRL